MPKRIIVHANVLVAALRSPAGVNREVIRACALGKTLPLIGAKLFLEYESVMGRAHLFQNSPLSATERQEFFDSFLSLCEWVSISFLWRPNLPDEGDIILWNWPSLARRSLLSPAIRETFEASFGFRRLK